ncbi:MAG: hypothetical protein JOZ25_07180 [Actinobacteria bacterium]|nr:hypothetical protein [Actinomycetota bacterium]
MSDWSTIASLATAGGTLVLAAATFASVRSANRAARVAERSLQIGLRPVLVPARPEDPPEEIPFPERVFSLPGGQALIEIDEGNVFLGIALRNVGAGLAMLIGGYIQAELAAPSGDHAGLDQFKLLQRDLFVPAGGTGYWHAGIRDDHPELRQDLVSAIGERRRMTLELLYGDWEGNQRTITRFGLMPRDERGWAAVVLRHWGVDDA